MCGWVFLEVVSIWLSCYILKTGFHCYRIFVMQYVIPVTLLFVGNSSVIYVKNAIY